MIIAEAVGPRRARVHTRILTSTPILLICTSSASKCRRFAHHPRTALRKNLVGRAFTTEMRYICDSLSVRILANIQDVGHALHGAWGEESWRPAYKRSCANRRTASRCVLPKAPETRRLPGARTRGNLSRLPLRELRGSCCASSHL